MAQLRPTSFPPVAFGLASVVLGTIALLLFFLPVLAIPAAVCGIVAGLLGVARVAAGRGARLGQPLAGLVVSGLALGIGVALVFARIGYIPERPPRAIQQLAPLGRPYVPPPARWPT